MKKLLALTSRSCLTLEIPPEILGDLITKITEFRKMGTRSDGKTVWHIGSSDGKIYRLKVMIESSEEVSVLKILARLGITLSVTCPEISNLKGQTKSKAAPLPSKLENVFALTKLSSIYKIDTVNCDPEPVVIKVNSSHEGTHTAGERLKGGNYIGFYSTTGRMILFRGSRAKCNPDDVKIEDITDSTSPLAGLFLTEEEAKACATETALQPFDRRFADSTVKILKAIGYDHPFIKIGSKLAMEIANL